MHPALDCKFMSKGCKLLRVTSAFAISASRARDERKWTCRAWKDEVTGRNANFFVR